MPPASPARTAEPRLHCVAFASSTPRALHRSGARRASRALLVTAMTTLLAAGVLGAPAASAAAVSTVSVGSVSASAAVVDAVAVRADQTAALRSFDRDLLAYINRARTLNHLRPLGEQPRLVLVADSWATHLASGTAAAMATFQHNPTLRATMLTGMPGITAYGENIAAFSTGSSAYAVLKAYLASPEHRANILSPAFRYAGIVTHTGPRAESFNTIDFAG